MFVDKDSAAMSLPRDGVMVGCEGAQGTALH